jgi:hypothetical protein
MVWPAFSPRTSRNPIRFPAMVNSKRDGDYSRLSL